MQDGDLVVNSMSNILEVIYKRLDVERRELDGLLAFCLRSMLPPAPGVSFSFNSSVGFEHEPSAAASIGLNRGLDDRAESIWV